MSTRERFLSELKELEENGYIKKLLSLTNTNNRMKKRKKEKSYNTIEDYIKVVKEFTTSEFVIDFETRLTQYKLKTKLEESQNNKDVKNVDVEIEIDRYEIELINKLIKRYNELLKETLIETDKKILSKKEFKDLLFKIRTLYRKNLKNEKSKVDFLNFVDTNLKYSFDLKSLKFLLNLFIEHLNSL